MTRRKWIVAGLSLVLIAAVGGLVWWSTRPPVGPPPLDTGVFAFDGPSDHLKSTLIVPTLDTPAELGKNVVWCSSFALAWKQLERNVTNGPVKLDGAQGVADRLNTNASSEDDLPPGSVFADAGLADVGIRERIRAGMAERFPGRPVAEFDVPAGGAVAFTHLEVSSQFEYPYFEYETPQPFGDLEVPVQAFGIREHEAFQGGDVPKLRSQVGVLYRAETAAEFALDLNVNDLRDQIVVARVERKPTLAEQLTDLNGKMAAHRRAEEYKKHISSNDTVLVPNIGFRITHYFRELEVGPITAAYQTTQFRLNRSGADVKSESRLGPSPAPRHYHFDGPFLVVMKRRDRERPYFVAWIDNAELLEK